MSKSPVIAAFLAALAIFTYIHASPDFGDADAFYHLEMARLTAAGGPVTEFTWLPFTTLSDHFADHHFLYHLALIPFLDAFGDPWGLKTATVVFGALAAAAFCFLLKDYGVRRPFLWTLPIFLAPGLVFRILLTKATSLALAAFFLFLVALRREKRLAIFGIAFAYVWLHGGWPLLILAGALDAVLRRSMRLLWPLALGLAAGLIANPFFPDNLRFYWEQIVHIALIGTQGYGVYVGNEWLPQPVGQLLANNLLMFAPVIAVIGLLAFRIGKAAPPAVAKERMRSMAFVWTLGVLLMAMTLRQARHKEYAMPVLVFAAALLWDTLTDPSATRAFLARTRAKLGGWFLPGAVAVSVAVVFLCGYEIRRTHRVMSDRQPYAQFEASGAWMRENIPPGEIIFHTAWDAFPFLFYRDPEHRYIAGLDPRFLHRKDPALYWRWRDLSEGRVRVGLAEALAQEFGARYVFLETAYEPLAPLMQKDPSFERVYADAEAEVWKIRE